MKSRQTTDSCGRDGVWCDFSMFRVVQNVTGVWTPSMWPTCILQVRISVHKRVSQAQATIHQRKENLKSQTWLSGRNCHVETHHSIADWDYSKILIFAGDLEVSKSTSGSLFCIFGRTFDSRRHKEYMDVQETNFSFTQFHWIWGDFFKMQVYALDLWDSVMDVFTFFFKSTQSTGQLVASQTLW